MVDGGSLENCWAATSRGFESLRLRFFPLIAMKKTLILLTALLIAGVSASAQISLGFGPATRIYYAKSDVNSGNVIKDVSYTIGVQVNFEDSHRVSDAFGYSAGIDFGTYKKSNFYASSTGLSEMYVDIPVCAKLYMPFSDDFQLFFFGGIVPSACISSNIISGSGKSSRFGKNSTYSRFDALLGGGIGCEISERIKLALGYDYGLTNRSSDKITDLHVAAAKFTFSYMF